MAVGPRLGGFSVRLAEHGGEGQGEDLVPHFVRDVHEPKRQAPLIQGTADHEGESALTGERVVPLDRAYVFRNCASFIATSQLLWRLLVGEIASLHPVPPFLELGSSRCSQFYNSSRIPAS